MNTVFNNKMYRYGGDVGLVSRFPTVSTTLLYSESTNDHLYTANQSEAGNAITNLGYADQGTSAYVYPTQVCRSVPLYRLYSSSHTDEHYSLVFGV